LSSYYYFFLFISLVTNKKQPHLDVPNLQAAARQVANTVLSEVNGAGGGETSSSDASTPTSSPNPPVRASNNPSPLSIPPRASSRSSTTVVDGENTEAEASSEFKNQVIRHGPQVLDEELSPKTRPGSRREIRKEGEGKEERAGSVIRHTPSERELGKKKK